MKPKVDVSRIGSSVQSTSQDSSNRKPRPVKVTVASSAIVKEVLSRAKHLKNCSGFRGVYISPDRSVEQRAEHRKLVTELKQRLIDQLEKRHFIRGNVAVYPANCRLPQTHANSSELRANSPSFRQHRHSAERLPEFSGVRPGSPEFARTPPRTGERFARKFVRGRKTIHLLRAFAANWSAANYVRRWRTSVRQKAYFGWCERSFAANCCSPAAN